MKNVIIYLCTFLFVHATYQAQEWKRIETLYGLSVPNVAMSSTDTSQLFIFQSVSESGGRGAPVLYASTDAGLHWEPRFIRPVQEPHSRDSLSMSLLPGRPDYLEIINVPDPSSERKVMMQSVNNGLRWRTFYGPIRDKFSLLDTMSWS